MSSGSAEAEASAPALLVIVQARLSSSRLPGKVLLEAGGKSLLAHLLGRVRRSAHAHQLVVATTTEPADERVAAEARRHGASVFRGSEADVLGRFAGALAAHPAEVVVRLTADNPLLDPDELDRVLGELLSRRGGPDAVDYVTNHTESGGRLPLGLDVEVFEASALQRAAREATEPGDREHVTPYLYRAPGRFRVLRTPYPRPELSRHRLTVDTPQDLALVRAVLAALGPEARIAEIARHLDASPELARVNAGVVQRGVESEDELRRRRVAGRLLFGRADASPASGYGHVVRLGALLEAWVELGGRAQLFGRGLAGSIAARLRAAGVELHEPAASTAADDPAESLQRAHALRAAAAAVDGYAFGSRWQGALRASMPLLAIDDLAAAPPAADLIVNQNLDFDTRRYGPLAPGQRLLAGAPYVLLRRGLRALLGSRGATAAASERRARVAVAFGGSDPARLTQPVLEAVLERCPAVELDVLVGPGVAPEQRERLLALASNTPRARVLVDPPEPGAALVGADVLVCAAGVTVWEAVALGVPAVLVTVADNQRAVAGPAVARGVALDAGAADLAAPRRAAELVRRLLEDAALGARLSSAGRQLIDGRGVVRVIDALLDVIERRQAPEVAAP